ncbi:NrdH-redoxin [Candidatus Uhrbacteria bacterium]|nr:NrdH-redoxin [Candidatus Uhrbacteria bacterium]
MKVLIYSTKTCPFCKMEKEYLTQKGVAFENIFVDEDETKAEEMTRKSGQMGVPVTVVTGDDGKEEVVVGFDKERLNQVLGLNPALKPT